MAQKSFRKSQLVEFKNTAAGHEGVLSDPTGSLIIKPCKPSEIAFYESAIDHPEFSRFIPTFMGKLSLSDKDPAQAAAALMQSIDVNGPVNVYNGISEIIPVDDGWKPSNGGKITTDCAIAMENVAHGYIKPNILDVKLGARLWADDAPPPKRAKLDKVAGETTSQSLGFRVAGMRTWQGPNAAGQESVNEDLYKFYDKSYGRALTKDNAIDGFREYFQIAKGTRVTKKQKSLRKVIVRFTEDLEELHQILEKEESRMYSASLLFVFEGDPDVLDEAFATEKQMFDHRATVDGAKNGSTDDGDFLQKLPKIQVLRLIDFAHAQWTPGQGPDENLLYGVRNVIKILRDLVE